MISVVMPTHRRPPFLSTTLLSVMSQSCGEFELVVVDASPDRYFEEEFKRVSSEDRLLRKYESRFCKIRVVKPTEGTGLPGRMKMEGFRNCVQDNDFCVFLDHDDFLYGDAIKNIYHAGSYFPNTEMVGMDYTSMMLVDGMVYTNKKTFMGGTPFRTIDSIYIDDRYYRFSGKQDVYRGTHPFKSANKPIIISKKALREKRFSFIEDTETMDDCGFAVMSHALVETYVNAIGYVYVGYKNSNSVSRRKVSGTANLVIERCKAYGEMLDAVGYSKHRNILETEN